jgi:hypothetical protein
LKFRDEREIADLAINFAAPSNVEAVEGIRVVGRKNPLSSYMLDIKYSKSSEDSDKVKLSLRQHANINYSFSPYSMIWVLETHTNGGKFIDRQKQAMSEELSENVANCLDKWMLKKENY